MAKQIAILKYTIMFDPSESWSNGYQFENRLADFFSYYGFSAQVIESKGGSGERIIWLEKTATTKQVAHQVPQPKAQKPASEQIKKVQTQTPTKSFKEFQSRGVPKSLVNQDKRAPDLSYSQGRSNRMKVRVP